ncbi:uncharacterized protein EV420DRAFT_1648441 [Desarmillaria tabescens]|uniref:Uncharacterized protein n=1 Tax=Armillaria tabescens TaxID=1929756 RepID=A0AA39MTK2_ARMTA|nr:uncharacterized protein EV420DRAFT_1648441 [Desarmillaria tabescens]KAK0445310.1 hypothetical protein EV420DRAFT_1648441 [Desarmillaria tabescens]
MQFKSLLTVILALTVAVLAVPYDDGTGGTNPRPTGSVELEARASNMGYPLRVAIWSSTDINLFDMLQPHNTEYPCC